MGPELGAIYHLLWNECAHIHSRWEEYVAIFGKDQEQFDVMNGVAPLFFKTVQDAFWESILLHLCRFADPVKVAHRKTLSLETLLGMPGCSTIPNLRLHVNDAKAKIKFAQDWRNRSLAHADLEHALDRNAKALAEASRMLVREALASITAVLACVERYFTNTDLYLGMARQRWDGLHLLQELRLLSILRNERDQRIKTNSATPDDLDWGKWD